MSSSASSWYREVEEGIVLLEVFFREQACVDRFLFDRDRVRVFFSRLRWNGEHSKEQRFGWLMVIVGMHKPEKI